MKNEAYEELCQEYINQGRIWVTEYRRGAVVTGWPPRWPIIGRPRRSARGVIRSQTVRSLIRASWNISNAAVDYDLMTTLTFRVKHPNPKWCLRSWMRQVPGCSGSSSPYVWVQEYQERGVVHYHILHTLDALANYFSATEVRFQEVWRRGKPVKVLSGALARYISGLWTGFVGDSDPGFLAFQAGGTTEALNEPEKAGYYMGRYVGKMAQKTLPDDEAPAGRWWFQSEAARPIPVRVGKLLAWPFDRPHRLVYDVTRIEGCVDSTECSM